MEITNQEQLREVYGWPKSRTEEKVLTYLEKHGRNFIQKSPFAIISTSDKNGKLDASPRGGEPGFVHIHSENEIIIPDAKGNNRVDSLSNIVDNGQIGMLFMIPGINETLRLNGTAYLTTDEELLKPFENERIPIKTGIVVEIEEVFLHCAKAFMRSKLWEDEYRQDRPGFPTMGQMLNDQIGGPAKIETQEEMEERYRQDW